MPAEVTRTTASMPRSASSRFRMCSAMTLRAVLAAQMIRTERKRGSPGAALAVLWVCRLKRSDVARHHLAHVLFGGGALAEFFLQLAAQLRGIPHGPLLGNLAHRMPSAHQPHRTHPDAEYFAVDILGVVAGEPGNERRNVRRSERIPL